MNFKCGRDRWEPQIQIPHPQILIPKSLIIPQDNEAQKDIKPPQVYTARGWVRPGPRGLWC